MRRAGYVLQGLIDALLNGMIWFDVACWIDASVCSRANKAGVFAGAIVADCRWRFVVDGGLMAHDPALGRPVATTFQHIFCESRTCEHVTRKPDVFVFSGVRCAGERQLSVAEAQCICRTGLNQR